MLKKTAFAALIAAGTMSVAAVAFAAETPTPAPVAAPAVTATMPSVSMGDALASAEKAYNAKSVRANLRQTAEYGLVWDVCLVRDDGTRVRAYVDARTGNTVAANEIGIRRNAPRAMPNPQCPMGGPGMGMGPGMGPGMGMGPNPDCPLMDNGPRHHRGYGFHRNW